MKKIISLVICVSLILCTSSVFANTLSDETEKILVSVKERIKDTSEYDSFDSSSYENNGKTVYSFEWYTSSDNSEYKSMSVECTSNGIITRMSVYDSSQRSYEEKPSLKKISQETALNNAYNLLKKLNPSVKDKLFLEINSESETLFSNQYRFRIIHKENGLEVYGDGGNITLNSTADQISSFYLNFTDNVTFEKSENIISKETAQKHFGEKLGIELKYLSHYENKRLTVVPCYTQKNANGRKYINALTGEVFEPDDVYLFARTEEAADTASAAGGGSNLKMQLSQAEMSEIETLDGLLTKEQVINILKTNKFLSLPSDFELTGSRVSKDYYGDSYTYNLSYEKTEKDNYFGSVSFSADARTGFVKRYSFYDYEGRNDKKIITVNKEKAYSYLTAAVNSLAKDVVSEYRETDFIYPKDTLDKNINYYASILFTRHINGIPYENDTISAELNLKTGKLERYYASCTDAEFPSIDSAVSEEEALETLFAKTGYTVKYVVSKDIATPVYMLDESKSIIIDAIKNTTLDYTLKEITESITEYTDLDGHYAADIIMKLKKYGIGFEDENFRPESEIIQKDFIHLLTSAFFSRYSSKPYAINYDEVYNTARNNGIISADEINREAYVTRIDAAKYMVRALGYEEIAKLDEIFAPKFTDVTEYRGYTNILYGLGIVKGDENSQYNPNGILKRAEAAVMIYNYLAK